MKYETIETFPFGENAYICYDEDLDENGKLNAFIVDPGGAFDKIKDFVETNKLFVKYVVLTHAHIDHLFAVTKILDYFKESKLVMSKKEEEVYLNNDYNLTAKYRQDLKLEDYKADILVNDGETLVLNEKTGKSLKFFITSGHTVGSMVVMIDDFLFTGDTLFKSSIGRYDLPTGSTLDTKASIEKIKGLHSDICEDPKKFGLEKTTILVLPGHGPSSTLKTEVENNMFYNGGFF